MPKTSIKDMQEFMRIARERCSSALAADAEDRVDAEEDVAFVGGDQWRPDVKKRRDKFKQPVLTWNRLPTFVAQVVNDGRENKPSIKTSPMDGGTKETSDFFQDRIRHIEYECDADIAYDTAREQQVTSGRAFIRVATEYKPGKSFEQRALIEPIGNQFSVLFDPSAQKYDRSDADWCFVFGWTSKENYERKYGKDTAVSAANYFANDSNPAPDWINVGPNNNFVQEAEYWVKEHKKRTLCLLPDLSTCWEDELPDDHNPDHVVGTCEKDEITVCQYVIDGVEVLDETEFPVPFIPIVPVWGKQMVIKGKQRNYSLVRFAKDPQRLVNLYVSNIAGEIARTSKTPYIVAEGQISGREEEWETINEDARAVVQYKAKDVSGTLIGKPSRETVEPPIQALTLGLNQAIDAIKAAMGIFDAALGAASNEKSGVAINSRKKESDVANFHFPDNEARSRKHLGRILLALIPVLDKGAKEVPTRTVDGKAKMVKIGQPYHDDETGQMIEHQLEVGDYEVSISTGPSYTSQRDEAAQTYAQIAQADKMFMQVAGDLYFRSLDIPGADEIADRYEKMLPPALKPQDPNQNGAAQAQQAQAALQQMSAQHQQLMDTIHQMSAALENKQIEADSKFKIAALQSWTSLKVAEIGKLVKEGIADADREAGRLESMFDRAHDVGAAAMDHAHGILAAQHGQDGASDIAAQNAAHASDASAQGAQQQMDQQAAQPPAEAQQGA